MPRTQAGFTLLEVLIATAILVTVAAGTTQLFVIALRDDVAARQQLAMSASAATKLDELTAAIAAAPAPAAAQGALDRAVAGYSDVTVSSGVACERRWTIAPLAGYGATAVVIVLRLDPIASRTARPLEASTIAEAAAP